jgi:hypothetical protein
MKSVVVSSFLNEMVEEGKTVQYVMGYSAQTKVISFLRFVSLLSYYLCFIIKVIALQLLHLSDQQSY